ncbi:excinuclease ABC subunit UvrC [Spartinivicinus poritis]|uniref:UvrABC system protein C n=1 Tax=Spartinivicinus poritis TaxID=2994640 RepID=A0ABT5UEE5_9GAMM|nr:excinuclease ABC subunit UvrC [Spartinivicinus sp. A2-2]MDE1463469.1 excinuclease ABC subunit UvrC [Spartinivicinus sp. A2-2]
MNAETSLDFDYKTFLAGLTQKPGIYQMYDNAEQVLYVGKAKNLKKRVSSYFRASGLTTKTMALVSKIAHIDVMVTNSEAEALILEQNLIKQFKPPYNILLRDDKSYPYIYLSSQDTFPRLTFHRGKKSLPGNYFGPFPSSGAVRESLNLLQKVFKVRQCEDSFFKNRSRPCLQYQINRCKAPCVGLVSEEEYQQDVAHSQLFLAGKNQQLIAMLVEEMEAASQQLHFEQAAQLRDQIQYLQQVQAHQAVSGESGDVDVIGYASNGELGCLVVMFVRGGRVLGQRSFFHSLGAEQSQLEQISAFLSQFYLSVSQVDYPKEVVLPTALPDSQCLSDAINQQAEHRVLFKHQVRGERRQWLQLAEKNATQQLASRLADKQQVADRLNLLQQGLGIDTISRIECFDISHSSGEATVASCVVFGLQGAITSDYRRYNIKQAVAGDDYGAMAEVLQRRYQKALVDTEAVLPDLVLIDGGKGQLAKAQEVFTELQLSHIKLVGVAKGVTRKPGLETLWLLDEQGQFSEIQLKEPGVLLLIQQVRDEAHRFAITGHRQRRSKARQRSQLEDIPGIGAKRRQQLLKFFGGISGVKQASVQELSKVPGVSLKLAEVIYNTLHPE